MLPSRPVVLFCGALAGDGVARNTVHLANALSRRGVPVEVGRLHRQKNYEALIDALAQLRASGHPHLRLLVLGAAPPRAQAALTARARMLGLPQVVRFEGEVANPFPLVRHAVAYVLPSLWGGASNSLSEATACGVPVVASRTAGNAADVLGDGRYGGRVALRGSGDDFDQLSATLNQMLERIEGLVASISRVSDNIAHELRTPLTRLRAELEELAGEDDPTAIRARSGAALDEAGRLQSMFEALLRIARLESGPALPKERVDLSALLKDAVELYAPAVEDKGQVMSLDIAPGLNVEGG